MKPKSNNIEKMILILVFVVALTIRVIGIQWGLPGQNHLHGWFLADEPKILRAALALFRGDYWVNLLHNYPFFYYLSSLLFALYYGVAHLLGIYPDFTSFETQYIVDISPFLVVGRLFVATFASLTVVGVFFLAKKMFDRTVAWIATIFMIFSFGHVVYSKVYRLDPFLPFLFVATFYAILRLGEKVDEKMLRPFVICGLLLTITFATKITGWALLVPFLLLPLVYNKKYIDWNSFLPRLDSRYVFAGFIAILFYIALILPILPSLGETFSNISRWVGETPNVNLSALSPYQHSIFWHFSNTLPRQMGWGIYLFAILGLFILLFSRKYSQHKILLLSLLVTYLLPIGYAARVTWRDMLPILPFLYILAALALYQVTVFLVERVHWLSSINLALVLGVLVLNLMPVYHLYRQKYLILQPDTRDISRDWIVEHIPVGSRLAIELYGPGVWDQTHYEEVSSFIRENEQVAWYDFSPPTHEVSLLSREMAEEQGELHPDQLLSFLKTEHIEYVVVSSAYYGRFYNDASSTHFPELVQAAHLYYDLIESNLHLVKQFIPDWRERPGPVIQIYAVPLDLNVDAPALDKVFEPFPGMESPASAVGYYQFSPR
ncbi:MAG: glycosyltransferase family 39 protein [Ardenticatenaceae bacterium]|nr:glycosyltransferase family 39 protein [Ardenticatenaceae bacterium]MCB8991963.1 glycosyltransferase family 39 protein [Ardenticatenaceae bacterium]MCB9004902.1 glycosyltransferase family 39 protein [Ardenticatenaceae bacterium]